MSTGKMQSALDAQISRNCGVPYRVTHKLTSSIHLRNVSQDARPNLVPVIGRYIISKANNEIFVSVHVHTVLLQYPEG